MGLRVGACPALSSTTAQGNALEWFVGPIARGPWTAPPTAAAAPTHRQEERARDANQQQPAGGRRGLCCRAVLFACWIRRRG